MEMPSDMVMVLKITALPFGLIYARRRRIGQFVDVHIARRDHAPGRRDADLRLFEVVVFKTDGMQHGATGRAFHAVNN